MDLTLPMLMPWLLAAAALAYNIIKDRRTRAESTETRLRALELAQLTDKMHHAHQLELLAKQLVTAQGQVQETRNLISRALTPNHAN